VQIVPSARDEIGQIKDGHIDLRGKFLLFPDLDDILEHRWKSSFFDPWSFGLDALPSLPNPMNRISFLPIAQLEQNEFTFHGLLLHNSEDLENVPCYSRIGVARVFGDGNIAGSGSYVDGWTSPPWPAEELQTIRLK
jgi:hypothetical protein